MTTEADVAKYVVTTNNVPTGVVAQKIQAGAGGEEYPIYMIFNPTAESVSVELPEGKWTVYVDGKDAGITALYNASRKVKVAPITAMILVQDGVSAGNGVLVYILVGVALLAAAGATVLVLKKKKK
jgi:hypothetical protein